MKRSGAVRGIVPLMASSPFTVTTTSSGEIGRASVSRDFTSITTSPAGIFDALRMRVRATSKRLYS